MYMCFLLMPYLKFLKELAFKAMILKDATYFAIKYSAKVLYYDFSGCV